MEVIVSKTICKTRDSYTSFSAQMTGLTKSERKTVEQREKVEGPAFISSDCRATKKKKTRNAMMHHGWRRPGELVDQPAARKKPKRGLKMLARLN